MRDDSTPRAPSIGRRLALILFASLALLLTAASARAQSTPAPGIAPAPGSPHEQTFRLHEGITAYVLNPEGKDFAVGLDVRDINLFANGPREILFKVYDPDGIPVVREFIPDDGCSAPNNPERLGGWDHTLQSYVNQYAHGTTPWVRWGAWSDPGRLATIVKRTFDRPIKGGKKGVYRVLLAGCPDHYVTLRLSPDLIYGVAGHPSWTAGHGDLYKKSYIYVPKGTTGLSFAFAEFDLPRTRRVKLTAPDEKVLFDGVAEGGYVMPSGQEWADATAGFEGGGYDGKLLTLEVGDGPNDYLVRVVLQMGKKAAFADYVGMGSSGVLCPDEASANAIAGGTFVVDGETFWHPFQAKLVAWVKAHPYDPNAATKIPGTLDPGKALHQTIEEACNGFRLIEASDGRGSLSWPNWAYAMGYYGCNIFRPSWLLMKRDDVPDDLKALLREGLIMAGDRLSVATGIEKVNGNAFTQINVALWYSSQATGDPLQKERFETFWKRWTTEGWGPGSGISRSGDSQEHFAHDMHYGSYIMDNWAATGNIWVKGGGILGDAADDPRFAKVMERYYDLYSYLLCLDGSPPHRRGVAANPWSSRTHMPPIGRAFASWETPERHWKGEPGDDFAVDVNGGHEWFAARRRDYYLLTFHGRLAPDWMSGTFEGQLGFGGGIICQLTVPGRGVVLASTLNDSYGKGMHPTLWEGYHIHALVGERFDGMPIVSGISEHDDARLEGDTLASSGEIRGTHLRVKRTYKYRPDGIDCSVELAKSRDAAVLFMWGHEGRWSDVRLAYEMIPYLERAVDNKSPTRVTADDGAAMTAEPVSTKSVKIDRGGFGVEVRFERPTTVKLGKNGTLLVELVAPAPKPTPAERVALKYTLAPYGGIAPGDPATQPAPKPEKAPPGGKPAAATAATKPAAKK
ncbi:MAG: hypothetical protein NTW19_21715 [Planctomycetota bacterium]|nr:hypothetical protein [Planctomycetota bacterium]